jgi:DnaK suppressor protein
VAETRWTQQELKHIHERLIDRLSELRADIQRELRKYDDDHFATMADRVGDAGDESVADLLVDVDLAEITRDVEEVREVEAALLALARGRYGNCSECGQTIDAARLHYRPSASRCVSCQQRLEQHGQGKTHTSL